MEVTAVTRERLVDEVVELVVRRAGRTRVVVDGAPPSRPGELAAGVAQRLRVLGRPVLEVAVADFLRPASVRLEYGHTDPDALLDSWLDIGALRREVLDPARPDGSGQVLPRLWDVTADRSYRDGYAVLPANGVVLLTGSLLLGRGLPIDVAVHLHMSAPALARHTGPTERWTLAAYARYATEHDPLRAADLVVLADHPDRPAVRR